MQHNNHVEKLNFNHRKVRTLKFKELKSFIIINILFQNAKNFFLFNSAFSYLWSFILCLVTFMYFLQVFYF